MNSRNGCSKSSSVADYYAGVVVDQTVDEQRRRRQPHAGSIQPTSVGVVLEGERNGAVVVYANDDECERERE